ncbi:hypothetical protein K440DRAFT_633331 [Wilcoxina mikolae CBS 423.85]|nr:hypothetical protein K440DRAFT_633331 [Wilcoxina mikolae CBS 423.85]
MPPHPSTPVLVSPPSPLDISFFHVSALVPVSTTATTSALLAYIYVSSIPFHPAF